jgi:hypothetical protein
MADKLEPGMTADVSQVIRAAGDMLSIPTTSCLQKATIINENQENRLP